ncbi:MAG: DUF4892 domain-containing protein [Brevundimonas sp.]|jgi:hypothetical protein|uniref:hypothetical protein n=1 Tax=Brevundimonas sp. TaxID=1871086 RepID=UPI0025C56297|nr:hypothetical protein [Brevundimonas sp.]MCH4267786.1 DUF4892 domain-containing protein [Brevundimonas sp.]
MRSVPALVVAFLTAAAPLAALASPPPPFLVQQDVRGASDHDDLPRMDGARIRAWRQLSVAEITLPTGAVAEGDTPQSALRLQGQISHLDYVIRPAVAPIDMARHYEEALREGGYETVFACTGIARCGSGMGALILLSDTVAPAGFADGVFNDQLRVVVARKGATWVLLHMTRGPDRSLVYQAVIEGARELE